MRRFFQELEDFFKKGDMVLLLFALVTSAFGLIAIASSTQAPKFEGNFRYIAVQIASIVMGVIVYAIMSSIDIPACCCFASSCIRPLQSPAAVPPQS